MGGNRPYVLAGQRDFVLQRLAEEPDMTLRGLAEALAQRGIKVSIYAIWHFLDHEGLSFKKKRARQRAGSARRCPPAHPLEAAPGQA
jgi:transposase